MIPPDEALRLVLATARPAPARTVPLLDAVGLHLAQAAVADRDYPPFDRAMMDGYAVRVADAGHDVRVAGQVAAGHAGALRVSLGRCVEIMTGAPCPPGNEPLAAGETLSFEWLARWSAPYPA